MKKSSREKKQKTGQTTASARRKKKMPRTRTVCNYFSACGSSYTSHIGATKKKTHHPRRVLHPGRAKVAQLEVPVFGDEKIRRLHIAMHSTPRVHEVQRLRRESISSQKSQNPSRTRSSGGGGHGEADMEGVEMRGGRLQTKC